jgi:hypothetical protein
LIGGTDQLRFVAIVKTGFQTEGLRDVMYLLEDQSNGTKRLVRKSLPRRFADAANPNGGSVDEVFEPVQTLKFQYLNQSAEGALVWQDSWVWQSQMPSAVRIAVEIGSKNVTGQSSRVVPLRPISRTRDDAAE